MKIIKIYRLCEFNLENYDKKHKQQYFNKIELGKYNDEDWVFYT